MAKRRKFSAEFKARVVLQLLSGEKTSAEICREHRLSAQQLSNWKRQFLENAPMIFENGRKRSEEEAQIAELERMVGKLTMQLEIAKKASDILRSHQIGNGQ
jgi:transposase-like protein